MAVGVGIGAGGVVGLAVETTSGTYEAPTKFFPIRSESVQWTQDTVWRRVIRDTADVIGAVEGHGHVEGSIDMEVLDDVLVYFLQAARGTLTKSGTAAPFTYDFTPSSDAEPGDTLSLYVERNGIVFGYAGCVVSQMTFSVDNGQFVVDIEIIGLDEANQSSVAHTFDDAGPFGAGMWAVELPQGTQITDTDDFTFTINDNGEAQNRLDGTTGAAFVSYGEREVTLSLERDFTDRTEYDNFKSLTDRTVRVKADNPNAGFVDLQLNGSVVDSFDVSLSGQGDLIRSSIDYMGVDSAGTGSYAIQVESDEDITI